MTVIAWDGQTLAGDKRSTFGGVTLTTTKIQRTPDGSLIGAAGPSGPCRGFMEWFCRGRDTAKYLTAFDDVHMLAILPDGTAWMFDKGAVPMKVEQPFCAIGAGMSEAMVAMACGKTAEEAVELTSRYVVSCGNGVDTLTLKQPP